MYLIPSCNKEVSNTNNNNNTQDTTTQDPAKIYLTAIEQRSDDSSFVYHLGFEYDAAGRIIRCSSHTNNSVPVTNFTVTYNGNQALYAKPIFQMPGLLSTDTILFTLDANHKAIKRLEMNYQENDDTTGSHPIRTYTYDTTSYEYDATGLLQKETRGKRDSITWITSGSSSVTNTYISSITDHTISNGNVTGESKVAIRSTDNEREETTLSFEYNNAYANKSDFNNAAILGELNLFYAWPLNNGYKNMPEKINTSTVYKDSNGNIFNTISSTNSMSLTFSANGYLATMFDPAYPTGRWYYIYNK
jgi:hypothetical protein